MYRFCQEWELFKPVSDYFEQKGYTVRYEIRIGFCRADIVAFKNDTVVGVELKICNWKKAIIQAKNYQLGCDYIFLAFPRLKISNVLCKTEQILRKEGLGLLAVDEKNFNVQKIIDAKQSNKKMGSVSLDYINRRMFSVSRYKFL
jgi:hypothetical protein